MFIRLPTGLPPYQPIPFPFQHVATPSVVKRILRMKSENSGLFAWEIRDQLIAQQVYYLD